MSMWLDWLVSYDYGFSVSALWCPLATPPSWVSLTLDMGYLFTAAPAKCSRCSLPWARGIFSPPPLLTLNVALSNSLKLRHALWGTQDRWVMVERSDRMWSTGEGNGKPVQYSCLGNPMNSMKRQNDRILKEELPRSVGAQNVTGD